MNFHGLFYWYNPVLALFGAISVVFLYIENGMLRSKIVLKNGQNFTLKAPRGGRNCPPLKAPMGPRGGTFNPPPIKSPRGAGYAHPLIAPW